MRTIYLDGRYIKVQDGIIEVFTPGFFKAQGVFETMLGLDGVVIDTALHFARLRSGLKVLGIKPPSIDPLVLTEILRRNHLNSGRVRLMVWQEGKQAHVMLAAWPYKVTQRAIYHVCYIKTNRTANARLANVKSLDYGLFAQSYAQAQAQGYDEALLLNSRGKIFEASRANIFWIKDQILYTPPLTSGCLNGITRRQVIKQAKRLNILLKEKDLTLEILKKSDAAFLTNSLIGIKPIEITMISNISTRD